MITPDHAENSAANSLGALPISLATIRKDRDLGWPTRLTFAYGNYGLMSSPVALSELLAAGVQPSTVAAALRAGQITSVSRHVYAECDGYLLWCFGLSSPRQYLPPVPCLHAEALARQHGWRLAIGSEIAEQLCGLRNKPLFAQTMGYDQGTAKRFDEGLQMEPVCPALPDWPVAVQILARGLGRRIDGATPAGLARHGEILGRMNIWRTLLAEQLGPVFDLLTEPLRIVALAIREQATHGGAVQRAMRGRPLDWQPPGASDQCARVEEWYLATVDDQEGGSFEALRGRCLSHPYADPLSHGFRSSPILWIDEAAGWAMAESRLYRLGQKGRR